MYALLFNKHALFLNKYNTIQLIFEIALLPYACQAQKCIYTPRLRRCNCNAEHCGRGTCSRLL